MANGTLAASQIEMLSQSGTGIMTIDAPATNTNQTLTLPDSTGTVATLGTSLTLATAVAASGTSVDFTSIPSWVKRITVMFKGLSTNGTSAYLIRLGTSGGLVSSGYLGGCAFIQNGVSPSVTQSTTAFVLSNSALATHTHHGAIIVSNLTGNEWVAAGDWALSNAAVTGNMGGSVDLGGVLTQLSITTVSGTQTFDAGTINIMYEG
jgi:hypothetical protein